MDRKRNEIITGEPKMGDLSRKVHEGRLKWYEPRACNEKR